MNSKIIALAAFVVTTLASTAYKAHVAEVAAYRRALWRVMLVCLLEFIVLILLVEYIILRK